jgi:GTP pyrophosphokinase
LNQEFKKYRDYIAANEGGGESVALFDKAVALFSESKTTNKICPGRDKKECLISLLDLLQEELNTYAATLIAAVLSQSVSGTKGLGALEQEFPPYIIKIVSAFFNLRKLKFGNIAGQADEARSLILSVAEDMRAVLLDFAIQIIRVRNPEGLSFTKMAPMVYDLVEHIYIPIAHRLGFYQLKSELEDRVLNYRNPEAYAAISRKLEEGRPAREKLIAEFILPVKKELDKHGLKYIVKSRTKSVSSIWAKMQKQDIPFEKVFDLWAVRIIIDSKPKDEKADCWHVYSVLTNIYQPNLNRLRDWITVPKETGYESLHATVLAPNKHWVEVQIRTTRMDDEAENGMAAHWRYKGGKAGRGVDFWLQTIRESLEKEDSARKSFLLSAKKFTNEVYVFTPAGDVKKLRLGSTVLDFAYAIHTEIGNTFASATVNGKIVPIDHVLKNGDQISIHTSKHNRPSVDWLKIVVDPRTKTKIKKVLDEKRQQEVERGKEILERRFKNWKMELNQELIDRLVKQYKFKKTSDLYYLVAMEKLDPLDIKKAVLEEQDVAEAVAETDLSLSHTAIDEPENEDVLIIDKLDNVNFSLAKCCNPIPGDPIFGFVTVSKGISIHRKDCPNAAQMRERFPYRIIESKWKSGNRSSNFTVNLRIAGDAHSGAISEITRLVSQEMKARLLHINFNTSGEAFGGSIKIKVQDNDALEILMEQLRNIKGVTAVYR